MDRRAIPGLAAGLLGGGLGVAAALFGSRLLAALAGLAALAAAAWAVALVDIVRRSEQHMRRSIFELAAERARARDSLVDADTGLPAAEFFEVAVQQRVHGARRRLSPVTIVLLDVAASDGGPATPEAIAGLVPLMRGTLREADALCRLAPSSFGVVLEDTTEAGGVWTAERLQATLARDSNRRWRLAAGVASYPAHGLRADEILDRGQAALARACAAEADHGMGAVEVAGSDLG